MSHASPSRRQPSAVRRAQILDAATACFSRSGYHGATMDDVVKEAGLSKGSLYWHFESKEEVLLAICDRYFEEFFAAWDGAIANGSRASAAALIVEGGELFIERMLEQKELAQTWIGFLEHPVARERMAHLYERSREVLVPLLREGTARGEFSVAEPEALAAGLSGLAEGILLQRIVDPSFDPIPALRASMAALLKGIAR